MRTIKYIGWLLQIVAVFVIVRAVAHASNVKSLALQTSSGVILSAIGFYLSCFGLRLEFRKETQKREDSAHVKQK
jgi:hypothetical protein